jgi:hypothetical protein
VFIRNQLSLVFIRNQFSLVFIRTYSSQIYLFIYLNQSFTLNVFFRPVTMATSRNSVPSAPSLVTNFGTGLQLTFMKSLLIPIGGNSLDIVFCPIQNHTGNHLTHRNVRRGRVGSRFQFVLRVRGYGLGLGRVGVSRS